MTSSEHPARRFGGLLLRRVRWGLSWRGRLLLLLILVPTGGALLVHIQPFLAVTDRVDANVLVVEGWVHKYAIRASAQEFRAGSYEKIFTTGGPVVGNGGYVNDYQTAASVGADLLRKAGVPDELLQIVPSRVADRDRTYGSAVALREWFRLHGTPVRGINIVTENVHARRTRLLFSDVFGNKFPIGIIAVPNPDYDQRRWWQYSEGVEDVVGQALAYVYAKLFFQKSE